MCYEITRYTEGISKAATVLSAMMKVYTIPCHDRGHINVVLVLQSCSDSLHILPSVCSQTNANATSDGVCNFGNIEVEEGVDELEEVFMSVNEEVDRGIKQEEIPGDIIFPYIKSEPDEVSYICMSVIGHILRVSGNRSFFVVSVFLANFNNSTVGNKNVLLWVFLIGGRVCTE